MGQRFEYKTPSRRRLKKWRILVERLAYSDVGRRGFDHWFTELIRCQPLIAAAKRAGVDLLSRLPKPEPITAGELRGRLHWLILGERLRESDWPTRENLEI